MIYKLESVELKGVHELGVEYYRIRYVNEKMDSVLLTTKTLDFEATTDKHILTNGTEDEIRKYYKLD